MSPLEVTSPALYALCARYASPTAPSQEIPLDAQEAQREAHQVQLEAELDVKGNPVDVSPLPRRLFIDGPVDVSIPLEDVVLRPMEDEQTETTTTKKRRRGTVKFGTKTTKTKAKAKATQNIVVPEKPRVELPPLKELGLLYLAGGPQPLLLPGFNAFLALEMNVGEDEVAGLLGRVQFWSSDGGDFSDADWEFEDDDTDDDEVATEIASSPDNSPIRLSFTTTSTVAQPGPEVFTFDPEVQHALVVPQPMVTVAPLRRYRRHSLASLLCPEEPASLELLSTPLDSYNDDEGANNLLMFANSNENVPALALAFVPHSPTTADAPAKEKSQGEDADKENKENFPAPGPPLVVLPQPTSPRRRRAMPLAALLNA